jgi:hypothetical protein
MFFLIGLLAVFNLISAYASYNNDTLESFNEPARTELVKDFENSQT